MLTITIPGKEFFDADSETFFTKEDVVLELEHSLVSLSKWESIFKKPFLGKDTKTTEEVNAYIKCMTITKNVESEAFTKLSDENYAEINAYIDDKHSATWFNETPGSRSSEIITSELIYYWLISYNIPFEVQHWHLNRLLTLIKVCNAKNSKPKKMSRSAIAAQYRDLNAKRKAQLGTSG